MFITLGVGLYTSRLVLATLGIEDYGIYGLVGGIVTMFSFMNSAMASATQRYLSFDIGKKDFNRLQKTFNATLNIHIGISFLILILAETIGLWFINYKLVISVERVVAANWVYQFSVFTFMLTVIQVPYNALLIAREHMKVYAYIGIFQTILKLIIVLLLLQVNYDKLIFYAFLSFLVSFVIQSSLRFYCKKYFVETIYRFYFDKIYYKELLSYSGWNLFGNIAAVARGQGSNILLNIFFGPVANAAYTLTLMVQGIIGNFISNFQIAVNPQIIKKYSVGDVKSSVNLMCKSAKFSFFGMLILVIPFLMNVDFFMHLWLKEIPNYTIEFIRLALIYSLIECISNPLMTGAQATGEIKWYQIIIGTMIFLTLPITWILFYIKNDPIIVYWVFIIISLMSLLFRIIFLKKMIGLDIKYFLKEVILKIILVSLAIYLTLKLLPFQNTISFLSLGLNSILNILITLISIFFLGISHSEKTTGINFITNKYKKLNKWKK